MEFYVMWLSHYLRHGLEKSLFQNHVFLVIESITCNHYWVIETFASPVVTGNVAEATDPCCNTVGFAGIT